MQKVEEQKGSNIFQKVIFVLKYIFSHWDRPPKGNFLSFREFAAYCVGGMGVFGVTVIPTYLTLSAGMYIAVALGINVWHITIIGLATSVFSLLRSPLLSVIIDNTNSRFGKFRPWLIWLPIPIMLSMIALVFIPYALIDNYVLMLVAFTIIFNIMQFFITLYSNAYNNLVLVISPSHKERTNLMSIGSVIYSLGPSIVTILFPLLANLLYSTKDANGNTLVAGINDIRSMQVILPIMAAMCLALALLTAFGVKERFVQKRATVNKVKFSEGLKSAARNKYFWINTISTILGVFRMAATVYVVWIATYYIATDWAQSILVTLAGSACVPGMILAPMLINKFGKKKIVIAINTLCAIFTVPIVLAASMPTVATPYVMYIFILLITLFNGATVVIQPALSAMINDYQQYKTGQRIEGFMGQLSFVLLTIVGLGTAFINPAIYEAFGFIDDASVLYDTENVTSPIIMWTSLIAIPSGILSVIPFLFWD
jgi:Na+/melibiose symporter-like transporter